MAGIYSQGGSAGHRYAGWLSEVEAKNFQFGGKVFNGSPAAIYVGSNLVWSYWLKHATWEAIYGAFGQRDGMAVIQATNAYLTQLAASGQAGKDKATALARFINEDPMMVCSLGLQPDLTVLPAMPIRFLVGDGVAYLATGIVPTTSTVSEILFKNVRSTSYRSYIGRGDNWNTSDHYAISTTNGTTLGVYMAGTDCAPRYSVSRTDVIHAYNIKVSGFSYDNLTRGTTTNYSTGKSTLAAGSGRDLWIFRDNTGDQNLKLGTEVDIAFCKIDNSHFIPCKHNGELGMYDIERKLWFGNENTSGSFDEDFGYMQNGQLVTWTPSTP